MPLSLNTAAWAAWSASYLKRGSRKRNPAWAQSIVKLGIHVPAEARTAETLGTQREGTGVVIEAEGLILTIGYLLLEADSILVFTADGRILSAHVAGFDHATGFGLVRTSQSLDCAPLAFGNPSAALELNTCTIATHPDAGAVSQVSVVGRRPFAGWWEYALDSAIFTAPARDNHSGAALIDESGKLIGIGSLWVGDAIEGNAAFPGNMFVPTDVLLPILRELKIKGQRDNPRPWIGVYTEMLNGHIVVSQVLNDAPGECGGVQRGDVILAVGETTVGTQTEFYKALWQSGRAGIEVMLRVWRKKAVLELHLHTIDRLEYLRPWKLPQL